MTDPSRKTILLVEDEAVVALVETRLLQGSGYHVIHVTSGEAAIQAVAAKRQDINLILMDIDLGPGMDGTMAAERILELRDLPILFLSSHTEKEIVEKTENISSYGYVVKNSSHTVLDASIKMAFKLFEAKRTNAESEKRYRSLFTEMLEGFALHEIIRDEAGKAVDYRFLDMNPAFEKQTGLRREDCVGRTVLELMPRTESYWIERYGTVALEGVPDTFENYSGVLDRHYQVAAFCPQPGQFATLVADISERKRSENSLALESERLTVTLRSIGDGVITTDIRGNIVLVNTVAEAMTGWTQEQAAGKPLAEVFAIYDETTRQRCANPVEKVLQTGATVELANHTLLVSRDGREILLADSAAPITDRAGKILGVVLVFRDITEQKRAEDSLNRTTTLLEQAFAQSPVPMVLVSMPDAVYRIVNPACREILGVADEPSPEGIPLAGFQPSYLDFDLDGQVGRIGDLPLARALQGQPTFNEERRIQRKDGTSRWVLVNAAPITNRQGDIIAGYLMMIDITRRKEVLELLRESEERLAFVLDGSQLGYWDWNVQTNQVHRNARWAEMLGYTLPEIESTVRQWTDLQHPADQRLARDSLQDHLDGRSPLHRAEYRMRAKDGSYRWILDQAKIVSRDSAGRPVRVCGTHTDITERRKAEENTRKLLLEKEILLKEVNHRVKNNMGIIHGLLTLQAQENPAGKAVLQDAAGRVQSMQMLYDRLYRSERHQEVGLRDFLEPLVAGVVQVFDGVQAVRTELRVADICLSERTLSPVGIIVNELVTNSLKHAFDGGGDNLISLTATLDGSRVILDYRDNGRGLPGHVTLDGSSGFGMQLVALLARQLDAAIRLEPGPGTRVVLEFGAA